MRKTILILAIASFCTTAFAAGDAKPLTVEVGKKPALALQLLEGWSAMTKGVTTTLKSEKLEVHVQLWNVPKVSSVAASVSLVPALIKGEVTDFKTTSSEDIEVAGGKGKHLIGTGTEADDGDPSNAEVFLFPVAGKVFLICAHGEGKGAEQARAPILEMLATVKKP
jgi:hypothetical protein